MVVEWLTFLPVSDPTNCPGFESWLGRIFFRLKNGRLFRHWLQGSERIINHKILYFLIPLLSLFPFFFFVNQKTTQNRLGKGSGRGGQVVNVSTPYRSNRTAHGSNPG